MGSAMAQMMNQMAGTSGGQAAPTAGSAVPDVMTLSEAAAYMRVGEEDVLEVIKAGELKAKQIGSSYRISRKAVDEFLAG
jgi:excisionase family DNA binding protein